MGSRMPGGERRAAIDQIKAAMMMKAPVTTAAKAQLMPGPAPGVAGNAGGGRVVFWEGRLEADNCAVVIL